MNEKDQGCVCSAFNLQCDHRIEPFGIDTLMPKLSWEITANQRGFMQSAYQIEVFSGEYRTDRVWDTEKVISVQSIGIPYQGVVLVSRQVYHWRVRVWNQLDQVSEWSDWASFEMGLLSVLDWQANWIEPQQNPTTLEPVLSLFQKLAPVPADWQRDDTQLKPAQFLRKEFKTDRAITRGRIYATAHGIYRLELNGQRVGDLELAPEATAYEQYLQYQTYDVTTLLVSGTNTLGAVLAEGWYSSRLGLPGDSCQYGDRQAILLQLEIDYSDGTRQIIGSDNTFKASAGPIIYADLFIGERYDARLELQGWSRTGFDDANWQPVERVDYGYANLVAQASEPIRVVAQITPERLFRTPKGESVLDLGQNIFGRIRMQIRGFRGTEINLEHSEVLDEQGNFLQNILGRNKDQKDFYVCRGDGEEIYEPMFTGHGFRYVRITGLPETARLEDFLGIVLGSDLRQSGKFTCSDPRINQLQHNIFWSQRGNMVSIPTDCPQRERAGFTGDAQVYMATACFNMDVHAFMTRWLKNMAIEQRPDGQIPTVVPYWKSYDETFYPMQQSHTSAGWGDACIIVPWTLFQVYGDNQVLADNYPMMQRWISYVQQEAQNGLPEDLTGEMTPSRRERQRYLWNSGFHFGDWLIPSLTAGYQNPFVSAKATKELITCCFYGYSTQLLADIADAIGQHQDAAKYRELNQKIRQAFTEEYLMPEGRFKADYQGTYVLALKMNMVPDTARGEVAAQLVRLIRDNGVRLDTGFVSVPYLMDVLCDTGHRDLAIQLLYQKECPSWLYAVDRGATTVWETWDAIAPNGHVNTASFNHYSFGAIGDWMYRNLAGIRSTAPGYRTLEIKPEPDGHLTAVSASYQSVYGPVRSAWRIENGEMIVEVTIPANTRAIISLPDAVLKTVKLDGVKLTEHADVQKAAQTVERVACTVGSGDYVFWYPLS